MARKRKSEATPLDEVDRTLYSTFCSSANSLSQLYTQAMNHQKVAFQAGERQALEKLYHWIIRQHEEGSRVTAADIAAHIEKEIDYGGGDDSPRLPFQHQFPHATPHFLNSTILTTAFSGQAGAPPRPNNHPEQVKNPVFSNALSSPVRRSLQPYQLAQAAGGPCYQPSVPPSTHGNTRPNEVNSSNDGNCRDSNSPSPNDSSMEMH